MSWRGEIVVTDLPEMDHGAIVDWLTRCSFSTISVIRM